MVDAGDTEGTAGVSGEGVADRAVGVGGDTEAEQERSLWSFVSRPSKVQVVALVLVSCLSLGPLVALGFVLRTDPSPIDVLVPGPTASLDRNRVIVTAIGLTPSLGELRVRVALQPGSDLVGSGARLRSPVTVAVNDLTGTATRDFNPGEVAAPFEAAVPIAYGTQSRYPFDRYEATMVLAVTSGPDRTADVPFDLEVRSAVDGFVLEAVEPFNTGDGKQSIAAVEWTADRPATTTVYAVWLMILMWGLAVTGLLIVWAVVIWRVDVPMWVFGYFVGVLFALPPLRDSLPGRPPPGTLFDFVSFYWSVAIVGTTLILLLGVWLQRARSVTKVRDLKP